MTVPDFVHTTTIAAPEMIDFLIVTILDSEFDAVKQHVPGLSRHAFRDDPIVYLRGNLPFGHEGESYSVAVIQLLEMGNPNAAVAVTTALRRFAPQATIVVGIAGAVPSELRCGDVAVSRDLIYYEYGKQRDGGLEHRAPPIQAHPVLWTHAKNFAESDWHAKITAPRPGAATHADMPQVKVGTIGSGEKVVDSAPFIAALKVQYKKLIAVAMEGTGAAAPAKYFGVARAGDILEIRGISDLADGTKSDEWQAYAADAAAAFMAAFLGVGPISPREPRATPASRPFTAVRMQSLSAVNPADITDILRGGGATTVVDAPVDLLAFTKTGGKIRDAGGAIALLTADDGPFVSALASGGQQHLAFYGHVHVPLAMLAGALATDRVPFRLFDFHRNAVGQNWGWSKHPGSNAPPLVTSVAVDEEGSTADAVVRVSVSYCVDEPQTAIVVPRPRLAYGLVVPSPVIDIVSSESQARAYAAEVRKALDAIGAANPRPSRIHMFYAGPVSVAFAIGQAISPSIHPPVIVWNYRSGEYDWGVNLARAVDGEDAVIFPDQVRPEAGQ